MADERTATAVVRAHPPPAGGGSVSELLWSRAEASARGSARHPPHGPNQVALDQILEAIPHAVLFLDLEGRIQYWNGGAERLLGYPRGEVLGRTPDFLEPGGGAPAPEALPEWTRGRTEQRRTRDGTLVWVSVTRSEFRAQAGKVLGVVVILRDQTERRARDEELQRARTLALVGELSAKVAHEVKNPLAGIYAALQVLEGSLHADDARREVFESIGDEVLRLDQLTQELLRFAQPVQARPMPQDLRRFLVDLAGDLRRLRLAGGVRLDLSGLGQMPAVPFDRALMVPVFENLLLNAIHANQGKGVVHLRSWEERQRVILEVRDDGPGVPEGIRDRVFEPFFTTKGKGTGLGLAIVRKNLELQGGKIELCASSTRGARFRIELPLGAAPSAGIVSRTGE